MSDIIEQWEQEIIQEASLKDLNSEVKTMYCHMIKYKYCKEFQDSTWVDTIFNSQNSINQYLNGADKKSRKLSKSVINAVNLDKDLKDAFRQAKNQTADNSQTLSVKSVSDIDIGFNSLDDLADKDKVHDWLEDNAKPDLTYYNSVIKKLDKKR